MKKYITYAMTTLIVTIALALAASDKARRTVELTSVDKSGITGTAWLEAQPRNQTHVELSINQGDKAPMYEAAIHFGVCEDIGGVAFKLAALRNGRSHTMIPLNYASIDRPYAVTLSNGANVVACGTFDKQ
jgi:hypothetical protein